MDRQRSKRNYNTTYDHYESDSQTPPPPRPKPHARPHPHPRPRRRSPSPPPPSSGPTTFFRILCPASKAGAVIGKSGSIINAFQADTGAWIDVHPLLPGDDERVIETSDNRRREPDGRPPHYSPAQEALLRIHDRILDLDNDGSEYDAWGPRPAPRATTRLVVPRIHVGCLMGKGGKIIEQMKTESRTHIRILTRDQTTPDCVSPPEEIVQISGDGSCVRKAVAIISSRLKESLHRDRPPFNRGGRQDNFFPPGDEFMSNAPHRPVSEGPDFGSNAPHRPVFEGPDFGSRSSAQYHYEDIVFRILCPEKMVESVFGASDGIIEMLREDVGVDVSVSDPLSGFDERIVLVTSDEGPDDELFPAQEALLHIQTRIVELGPDNDNIILTRLLVPSSEIGCLCRDGLLSEIKRLSGANVQILPKENHPPGISEADELVQIVGEIREARKALLQVTAELRSYLYRDFFVQKDMLPPSVPAQIHVGRVPTVETGSPIRNLPLEGYRGVNPTMPASQNVHNATATWQSKDTGRSASGSFEQEESNANGEGGWQSTQKRFSAPLVTKSTLEIVIPKYAVQSLTMRSGSKLAQISEISGATVCFVDDRPEQTEKIVKISGSPEQAERAQSLLQGFILSTEDDNPSG